MEQVTWPQAARYCNARSRIEGLEPCYNDAKVPFPGAPLGLYNGRPWFLPFAGAYYKILDWIS